MKVTTISAPCTNSPNATYSRSLPLAKVKLKPKILKLKKNGTNVSVTYYLGETFTGKLTQIETGRLHFPFHFLLLIDFKTFVSAVQRNCWFGPIALSRQIRDCCHIFSSVRHTNLLPKERNSFVLS
ncbi:hypothetical protein BaRGS_00009109 [Batillaria attramentaria]|uniref:Uncharacterized protein n=1 Tax=Batillaria attramentaria TaxID=370345 RepID=A0ABD0LKT4_9CAEN